MTRADVVQRLWDFINSAPAKNGAGATIINAEARSILEACNAAIQEIAHYAPRDFFKQTRSAVLKAPISATIDVTEDDKTFENLRLGSAQGTGSSNGSSDLTCSNHGLAVGDFVKFYGTLPTAIAAGYSYYVHTVSNANTSKVALVKGGFAIGMNASESFTHYKAFKNLPEGCSIEIDGADSLMRINTAKYSGGEGIVQATNSSNLLRLSSYAGTKRHGFIKDAENYQNALAIGDTVAFLSAVGNAFTAGVNYHVVDIDDEDGIGTTSGADTHKRYIKLSASAGGSPITVANMSATPTDFTLIKTSGTDSDSTGTFYEEYIGTTGTKTCTIYSDAVELNSKVTEVLGTVVLNDESVLTPLMNNDQSSRMHRDRLDQSERFGEYGSGWELPSELQEKKGTPSYYYIDSEHNEVTHGQNYYLRVRPFPEKKARLRFTASILPEKWVIQDTYLDTGQFKDTGCPADYDETILLPFVYKNFVKFIGFDVLPSEGSLQSGNILLQIDEDYKQAKEILKELQPQSESQPVYGVAL